jgi:hypothetical protein
MAWACLLVLVSGAWPLFRAWRANRRTTLHQAVAWMTAAWALWVIVLFLEAREDRTAGPLPCYLALGLTACAGIAVLGARRPGVGAWNFVVLGLLAVLLLPVAEGWGEPRLREPHLIFLAVALAVVLLNHVPTRLGYAVLCYAPVCGVEWARLAGIQVEPGLLLTARVLLALTPWVGLLSLKLRRTTGELESTWLRFRDSYGFLWAQRLREQFNTAAQNAGWPITLRWQGLEGLVESPEALELLRTTLKRFDRSAP